MSADFRHVLGELYNVPLAITPEKLAEIQFVVRQRIQTGHGLPFEAAAPARSPGGGEPFGRRGDTAIVPVMGVLTYRPSIMASGGTSAQEVGRGVDAAAADSTVTRIVLCISSPGGSVMGIPELAGKVAAAARVKPVVAVADPTIASAAYWIASQATEIVVTPSGQVGAIGVLCSHTDESQADEKAGIKTTVISAGRYKAEGYLPLTDDARAAMQAQVDQMYGMFVEAVARGRRTTPNAVAAGFGQGRMVMARDAVAAGMADRVGTFEDVLRNATSRARPGVMALSPAGHASTRDLERGRRERIARLAELGLELPPTRPA